MPLYVPPSIPGLTVTSGNVVVNENSADQDFRIESDNDTHCLFVEAGTDRVAIGLDDPAGKLHVRTTDTNYAALFETTDDSASAAPDVALYRNSHTPANGDDLGHLIWRGVETDGGDPATLTRGNYADIFCEIQVATTGSESGKMHLRTKKAGTMNKMISLTATEIVVNEDGNSGNKDIDFRIESTGNDNALFVNANTDRVGILTSTPQSSLDVRGANDNSVTISASGALRVENSSELTPPTSRAYAFLSIDNGDALVGGNLRLDDSVSGGTHDGYASGTDARGGSGIKFTNTSSSSADGEIIFLRQDDTNDDTWTVKESMRIDPTGNVGIGSSTPANRLQVGHTGADGINGVMIVREDTTTADGDLLGGIGFDSTDGNVPSSILEASAFIASIATENHGTGDKGGNLKFGVSLIDEDDDTVSTILANVGPPDTTANATTHPGLNSRATTAIVAAATYAPTIEDTGTLVIFSHANSNLTLPSINNTTTVGVQFTVFNNTGSAISAQIAVSNSATINGGAATANDDIASYKAATFIATGNNTWARIG